MPVLLQLVAGAIIYPTTAMMMPLLIAATGAKVLSGG
jgi:hypothetical protein